MKRFLYISNVLLFLAIASVTASNNAITRGVNHSVSINSKDITLSIYPNPASQNLYIKFSTDKNTQVELGIYDIIGKQVIEVMNAQSDPISETITVDIADKLNPGVYFVRLKCGTTMLTRRLIVR